MIPKIIHYCWFGPGFMPRKHKNLIRTWKKLMPDWQFMCWNESNFDIDICEYTRIAYEQKKYAFVSDVARLYALSKFGGIYLDTDVELYQTLEDYREHRFFSAIEVFPAFETKGLCCLNSDSTPIDININIPYFGLLSAVIGAEKESEIIHESLAYYGVASKKMLRSGIKPATGGGSRLLMVS